MGQLTKKEVTQIMNTFLGKFGATTKSEVTNGIYGSVRYKDASARAFIYLWALDLWLDNPAVLTDEQVSGAVHKLQTDKSLLDTCGDFVTPPKFTTTISQE